MPGLAIFPADVRRSRMPWLGVYVLALLAGCSKLPTPSPTLALSPAQMSPDSVVFDIYFIRVPLADPEAGDALWTSVDEQRIEAELRGRWHANGLRVGVISGSVPEALTRWMKLSDAPQGRRDMQQQIDLQREQQVTQRHAQLRRGQPLEVVASDVHETLPLLRAERDGVHGQTYRQAQCLFRMLCDPREDGAVEVDLLPQLQHGEPQQRWRGSDGVLRLDPGRPTLDFDDLRLKVDLVAGQMLLVASLVNRPGSLGHHFLAAPPEQKLLLIRLSQVQSVDGELLASGNLTPDADETSSAPPLSATAIVEEPTGESDDAPAAEQEAP
ncbi:MAG: hypothetical protein K1X74_02785 [Pirellulales bacterium]|nr:hypothetical protein [Pirellulales bacterium]